LRDGFWIKLNRTKSCEGRISIEKGTISIDCMECDGKMDLSDPFCFLGISDRMIDGFQGSIILMGEQHLFYEGIIVKAITAHSHILKDIHRLSEGRSNRKLRSISLNIEKDFKKDPVKMIEKMDHYLSEIRKAVREKEPPEADKFTSLVESTSKMIRMLERNIERDM
jgi:hypothetical protein